MITDGSMCGFASDSSPITVPSLLDSGFKTRLGPAGIHFFDRRTGMNILVDENIPPRRTWSSAPRQVSIALTNACDLTCSHCYAPKNPAILNFDHLASWLLELDANGCLGVGFGGGEPTLYPELAKLCSFVIKKTKLAVVMTTHAHQLSDQLLKELEGKLHFARVSMDGVGSTYESIRSRSFDSLLKGITALHRITNFGINYLVNSKTIGDIAIAVQLAARLGAAEFLLIPEVSVRRGRGIDHKTVVELRNWVNQYHGSVRLSISEGNEGGFPTCNPVKAEIGLAAFAHIDASGILKRTSYESKGVQIRREAVMVALDKLKKENKS